MPSCRRDLLVALALLALDGPAWPGHAEARLSVHPDDAPKLRRGLQGAAPVVSADGMQRHTFEHEDVDGMITHYSYQAELLPEVSNLAQVAGLAGVDVAQASRTASAAGDASAAGAASNVHIWFDTPQNCRAAAPSLAQPGAILVINSGSQQAASAASGGQGGDPYEGPPQRVESVVSVSLQDCSDPEEPSLELRTQQIAPERAFKSLHLTLSHGPAGYKERMGAEGAAHRAGEPVGSAGTSGGDAGGTTAGQVSAVGAQGGSVAGASAGIAAPGWPAGAKEAAFNDTTPEATSAPGAARRRQRRLQSATPTEGAEENTGAAAEPDVTPPGGRLPHARRLLEYDMGCRCDVGVCTDGHYGRWSDDRSGCDGSCGLFGGRETHYICEDCHGTCATCSGGGDADDCTSCEAGDRKYEGALWGLFSGTKCLTCPRDEGTRKFADNGQAIIYLESVVLRSEQSSWSNWWKGGELFYFFTEHFNFGSGRPETEKTLLHCINKANSP